MLYCEAVLPRTGLGNRLFPWARCRVFAFQNKVPMLSPRWAQLKIGPLLRGESDPRFYLNLFKSGADDLRGIRKLRFQLFSKTETEDAPFPPTPTNNGTATVRVFAGEQDRFSALNGWDQFLRDELRSITRERWLRAAERINDVPIGIHVRMGDFTAPKSNADLVLPQRRVPLTWFVDSLRVIREAVGYSVPAILVSPWVPRGTVVPGPEDAAKGRNFEHASIPATVTKHFLGDYEHRSPREKTAEIFLDLLTAPTARTDCPVFEFD